MNSGRASRTASNHGRKSKMAGDKRKSKVPNTNASNKLPDCPEGATENYTNQGPCKRRRIRTKRKRMFRTPLKKEDGNMEAQIVEYNAEFPNRVVVRLEYLMQSTKVRLNDREWMAEFYEKLVEEETRGMKQGIREREKGELHRMKRLIIEGINKDIPEELSYLHRHPVFRVNQMLQRLATFDHGLVASAQIGEDDEITPIEPYEFDGNTFFRHLHETGTLWLPEEEQHFQREKLLGKIYRAKLRFKLKREQKETEEKILRLLNNPDHPDAMSLLSEDDLALPSGLILGGDDTIDNSVGGLVDRVKTISNMTANRIDGKIRTSKEKELAKAEILDRKRRENEKKFIPSKARYSSALHVPSHEHLPHHHHNKDIVAEILKRDIEESGVDTDDRRTTIRMRTHDEFEDPRSSRTSIKSRKSRSDFDISRSGINFTGTLLSQLQEAFKIPAKAPLHLYENYDNEFVTDFDDNTDFEDTLDAAEEITFLYDRQKLVAEDHVAKPRKGRK